MEFLVPRKLLPSAEEDAELLDEPAVTPLTLLTKSTTNKTLQTTTLTMADMHVKSIEAAVLNDEPLAAPPTMPPAASMIEETSSGNVGVSNPTVTNEETTVKTSEMAGPSMTPTKSKDEFMSQFKIQRKVATVTRGKPIELRSSNLQSANTSVPSQISQTPKPQSNKMISATGTMTMTKYGCDNESREWIKTMMNGILEVLAYRQEVMSKTQMTELRLLNKVADKFLAAAVDLNRTCERMDISNDERSNFSNTTHTRQELTSLVYDPAKEPAAAFNARFDDIIIRHNSLPNVEKLTETQCRTIYYEAISKNCTMLQIAYLVYHQLTGEWYTLEMMKSMLLQAERDLKCDVLKDSTPAPMKQAMLAEGTCYICGEIGHTAKSCKFSASGLIKCYECGQMAMYTANQCRRWGGGKNSRKSKRGGGRGYVKSSKFKGKRNNMIAKRNERKNKMIINQKKRLKRALRNSAKKGGKATRACLRTITSVQHCR